jgi:hypothetical protein
MLCRRIKLFDGALSRLPMPDPGTTSLRPLADIVASFPPAFSLDDDMPSWFRMCAAWSCDAPEHVWDRLIVDELRAVLRAGGAFDEPVEVRSETRFYDSDPEPFTPAFLNGQHRVVASLLENASHISVYEEDYSGSSSDTHSWDLSVYFTHRELDWDNDADSALIGALCSAFRSFKLGGVWVEPGWHSFTPTTGLPSEFSVTVSFSSQDEALAVESEFLTLVSSRLASIGLQSVGPLRAEIEFFPAAFAA